MNSHLRHLKTLVLVSGSASAFLLACDDGGSTIPTDTSSDSVSVDVDVGADTDTDTSTPVAGSTAGILCEFSQSIVNNDESVNATSTAAWTCDATTRSLAANGLPDHEVGTFPNANNPSAITAQTVNVTFPLEPTIASETGTPVMNVAYILNGVKVEVGTAGRCTDAGVCDATGQAGGSWTMEAVGENSFDFGNDDSNGHVQPTGTYHYHGIPEGFVTSLDNGEAMTLVGWAVDGFPIYARYGYTTPTDAGSAIKVVTASYTLKATLDAGRPAADVYGPGAFTQDWEYTAGSGDLDECNGRFGVTPEFPAGIYHYYLTDTFPFGQRCVKGAVAGGGGPGPGPGDQGLPALPDGPGTEPIACTAVPAGNPCCGDDICGGPETAANCPADCD